MSIIKLISFLLLFLWPVFFNPVFAAMSFTVDEIIGNPGELAVDGEIEVKVSFSNVSGEKQYFLFLAFRKPESGAYNFGFTQNNDNDWTKYGDNFDKFYKVEIKEASWSGVLKIRPDYEANGFKGEGEYQVRAGRFVTSNSPTWTESNDLRITLRAPVPTETPTPIPEPTEIPRPTDTPVPAPTSTPVPTLTPKPTVKPTVKPSLTPTGMTESVATESSEFEERVLGTESVESSYVPKLLSEDNKIENTEDKNNKMVEFLPYLIILIGAGMIGFSVFAFFKEKKTGL